MTTHVALGPSQRLGWSSMPRTAAMKRRLAVTKRPRKALRLMRRLWSAVEHFASAEASCDRCGRPMLESCCRGTDRVCIQCVDEELARLTRQPIETVRPANPQLAGAAASLRALLLELQVTTGGVLGGADRARVDATIETAYALLWWLTPTNLRVPETRALDEPLIVALLERFDAAFGLRAVSKTLVDTYTGWRESQRKAPPHREHQRGGADVAHARGRDIGR